MREGCCDETVAHGFGDRRCSGVWCTGAGRGDTCHPARLELPAQTQHYVMMKKPELLKNLGKSYQIEWVNFPASVAIIQALASKNLDAGGVTIIPIARTIEQKAAVICASWLISRA